MAAEFATLSALMPPSEHNSTLCAITYDVTFRTTWTTKRKTPRNSSSDPRVKASEEQIARYLEGNWQEDLLFVLKQEQEGYEFCQQQMAERDRQLELQPKTPDFIPIGVSGEACGKCRILVWRARCSAVVGVFMLCVNSGRYFHLMGVLDSHLIGTRLM